MNEENTGAIDETPAKIRPPEPIKTIRHYQGVGQEEFVRIILQARINAGSLPADLLSNLPLNDPPLDQAVAARVDYGRWLADCPFCPGAELIDHDDLRFFCLSCYNASVGGRWLQVIAPKEPERVAIDAALAERPEMFRHWNQGATVADVQTENIVHEAW